MQVAKKFTPENSISKAETFNKKNCTKKKKNQFTNSVIKGHEFLAPHYIFMTKKMAKYFPVVPTFTQ